MQRYQTAFYEPIVTDWSNFGQWTEDGALDAARRANRVWKKVVADFEAPGLQSDRDAALTDFVERRTREGGAQPLS